MKKKKIAKKDRINEEYLDNYIEALAFGVKKPKKEKREDFFDDNQLL